MCTIAASSRHSQASSSVVSQPVSIEVVTEVEASAQAVAQASPLQRPDVDRKLLGLVVHGIGEQPAGSTLKHVANGFLPLIRARVDPEASIAAKPLDEGDPAEVKIWFRANDTVYELRFLEVWWAQAFEPPSLGGIIAGLAGFFLTWLKRPTRRAAFWAGCRYWDVAIWQRIVVDAAIIVGAPLIVLLLLLLWLAESVGPERFLPKGLLAAHRLIVNVATRHLGDVWVYMRQPWDASRIRVRFEGRFQQVVELAARDPEPQKIEAVFVIAHSMGGLVAYEALTGRRMTDLIQRTFRADGMPRLHFITVGSALNSAWDVVPDQERFRFYREFVPVVHWLNLWSGPDPVPRGALRRPPPSEVAPRWRRGGPASFKDVDVVNQMDVFSDHSAYWNNAEEVIAPMLNAITGGELEAKLKLRIKARRLRVRVLATLKGLAWLLVPGTYLLALAAGAGQGISDWASQGILEGEDWQRYLLSPLLWAAAIAAGVAVLYSTVVKWAWDLLDRRVKYRLDNTSE